MRTPLLAGILAALVLGPPARGAPTADLPDRRNVRMTDRYIHPANEIADLAQAMARAAKSVRCA